MLIGSNFLFLAEIGFIRLHFWRVITLRKNS